MSAHSLFPEENRVFKLIQTDPQAAFQLLDEIAALIPGFIYINEPRKVSNIYASEQARNILGQSGQGIDQQKVLKIIHPDDHYVLFESVNFLMQNHDKVYSANYRVLAHDGSWRWISSSAKVLTIADDGLPQWVIALGIDITDQMMAMEEMEQKLNQYALLSTHKDKFDDLSNRERDVLWFAIHGMKNNDIADKLHLSYETIKTHRKNINRKLGVSGVMGLARYAFFFEGIHQNGQED